MLNNIEQIALFELTNAMNPEEAYNAWNVLNLGDNNRTLLVCLPDYWKSVYPDAIKNIIKNSNGAVSPYFESDKIYFFQQKLIEEMYDHGNEYQFPLDYSIMFDSNFSSYVHKFVSGVPLNQIELSFIEMLDSLLRNDTRFDYFFYLIENYWYTKKLEIQSDELANQHKIKQYMNMVSFEMFKNIDADKYKETGKVEYKIDENEARILTDSLFNKIYNDKSSELMKICKQIHNDNMLFLIGILKIRYSSKKSANNKICQFLDYTNEVIGSYLARETYIAFEYFQNPKALRILEPINNGIKRNKLKDLISNIAWDFAVPRVMELFIKEKWEGRFFIPFFLTFDEGLKFVLNLYKTKGIIINQNTGQMIPFRSDNGFDVFIDAGVKYDFEKYASKEQSDIRLKLRMGHVSSNYKIIEEELEEILKCT